MQRDSFFTPNPNAKEENEISDGKKMKTIKEKNVRNDVVNIQSHQSKGWDNFFDTPSVGENSTAEVSDEERHESGIYDTSKEWNKRVDLNAFSHSEKYGQFIPQTFNQDEFDKVYDSNGEDNETKSQHDSSSKVDAVQTNFAIAPEQSNTQQGEKYGIETEEPHINSTSKRKRRGKKGKKGKNSKTTQGDLAAVNDRSTQDHHDSYVDERHIKSYMKSSMDIANNLEKGKRELKRTILNDIVERISKLQARVSEIDSKIQHLLQRNYMFEDVSSMHSKDTRTIDDNDSIFEDYEEISSVYSHMSRASSGRFSTWSEDSSIFRNRDLNTSSQIEQLKRKISQLDHECKDIENRLTYTYVSDFINQCESLKQENNFIELKLLLQEIEDLNKFLDVRREKMKLSNQLQKLREKVEFKAPQNRSSDLSDKIRYRPSFRESRTSPEKEIVSDMQLRQQEQIEKEIKPLETEKKESLDEISKLNSELYIFRKSCGSKSLNLLLRKGSRFRRNLEENFSVNIRFDQNKSEYTITGVDQEDVSNADDVLQSEINKVFDIDIRFKPGMYVTIMKNINELQEKARCKIHVDQLEGCLRIKNAESVQHAKFVVEESLNHWEIIHKTFAIKQNDIIQRFNHNLRKKIAEKTGLSSISVNMSEMYIECRGTRQSIEKASREIQRNIEKFQAQIHETITIPVESVKRIIGKSGTTIRSIEYLAISKITVDQTTGDVKIRGPSKEKVSLAIDIIQSLIEHKNHARVEVHDNDIINQFIGKGGKQIRELERNLKCHFMINDGVITIIAPSPKQLQLTRKKVEAKLDSLKSNLRHVT